MIDQRLSIGQCATLACLLEVSAPKPGNVHRGADFDDLSLNDFLISAVAIGPVMESAREVRLGTTVLEAVKATRRLVNTNTNLGTILLLAPLASVPCERSLRTGIADVLRGLSPADCHEVYRAIRLAQPGGLGRTARMDLAGPAPDDLLAAMKEGAGHDLVARQYVENFALVLETVAKLLLEGWRAGWSLASSVVHAHVSMLAQYPDSLIARKCGAAVAAQASHLAQQVLEAGTPGQEAYERALGELDFWLRSDGHRRNPGTTADLVAAGLFVALREQWIKPPYTGTTSSGRTL